jgi:hypothetical protein
MDVPRRALVWLLLSTTGLCAQVIEFESNGLKYLTMTKGGLTVMYAHLPAQLKEYTAIQVAVSNGSPITWNIRPDDFQWVRSDGTVVPAIPARSVVGTMIERGNRNDVIKLVATYESGLYGMSRVNSTNGYEQRRQAAMAELGSTRIKAAAAASAIVFVETKLASGQSTDGAIFYHTLGRPLGPGKLVVHAGGETFVFDPETAEAPHGTLQRR